MIIFRDYDISFMQKYSLLLFVLIVAMLSFSCQQKDSNRSPNIVLIFIDDLGYADIGCFGAKDYATPNIDQLAENGIRFTNFYASQAVCSASRASLLTGCYSERVGIEGALNHKANVGINPNEELIPEMLKKINYTTGMFGKWHLGHHPEFLPLQNGFDEFLGLPYSNDMWPVGYDGLPISDSTKNKVRYPPLSLIMGNEVVDTIRTLDDQGELTKLYTEHAIDFIQRHLHEPFFLYLPHSMVHVPLGVSPEFKGKSGKGLFADVMMELDWSVGRIMQTLEENDLLENTLVIFTSDNGPWLNYGNHAGSTGPLRGGKGNMWEGGPRVPTIISWPGHIPAGLETDELGSTLDILPTLAGITRAELPENKIDGINLLPLLTGETDISPRNEFYFYYSGSLIAVRRGDWKLVFPHRYRSYEGVKPGRNGFPGAYEKGVVEQHELYNLASDIGELQDVSARHTEIVAELKKLGDTIRKELGDRLTNTRGTGNRKSGRISGPVVKADHLALGKKISVSPNYAFQYSAAGDSTLVDGELGSLDFKDDRWLGFEGKDAEILIDLDSMINFSTIECRFLVNQNSWIFAPERLDVLVSADGKSFALMDSFLVNGKARDDENKVLRLKSQNDSNLYRYIKIQARNIMYCPHWHEGAGGKAWLFLDEVVVK